MEWRHRYTRIFYFMSQSKSQSQKFTPKQLLFCKEYLKDKNAAQAAIRAGYSKKTANVIGAENLLKPYLKAYIDEGLAKQAAKIDLTAENVLRELHKLAFSNMADCIVIKDDGAVYADLSKMNRDQLAAISEITVPMGKKAKPMKFIKLKLTDKRAALVTLARHFNLLTTKTGFVPGTPEDPGTSEKQPAVEYHTHINLTVKSSDELTDLLLGRNGFGRPVQAKLN